MRMASNAEFTAVHDTTLRRRSIPQSKSISRGLHGLRGLARIHWCSSVPIRVIRVIRGYKLLEGIRDVWDF